MGTVFHMITSAAFIANVFMGSHHNEYRYHWGDTLPEQFRDFGLFVMSTTWDKVEKVGNPILNIAFYGDHSLYHFFSSVDQAKLRPLWPIFKQTAIEFGLEHHFTQGLEVTFWMIAQFTRSESREFGRDDLWPGRNADFELTKVLFTQKAFGE
jgi:hypothetical protein